MRHHANDGARDAVHRQRAPDGRGIGMKTALPQRVADKYGGRPAGAGFFGEKIDRKSTRLNFSHLVISYALFFLETKNIQDMIASLVAFWALPVGAVSRVRDA